jgi:hypothetical protein
MVFHFTKYPPAFMILQNVTLKYPGSKVTVQLLKKNERERRKKGERETRQTVPAGLHLRPMDLAENNDAWPGGRLR